MHLMVRPVAITLAQWQRRVQWQFFVPCRQITDVGNAERNQIIQPVQVIAFRHVDRNSLVQGLKLAELEGGRWKKRDMVFRLYIFHQTKPYLMILPQAYSNPFDVVLH